MPGSKAGRPAVDHGGGMPRLSGPQWYWDVVSESSMAIAPLALAVQRNHEHRDVVVGHLPFLCGIIVLPLCGVYQHLGQLREPVGIVLQMYSGARAKRQGQPSGRTYCTGLDTWGPKQCVLTLRPGKQQAWKGHRLQDRSLDPEIFGTHRHPHPLAFETAPILTTCPEPGSLSVLSP